MILKYTDRLVIDEVNDAKLIITPFYLFSVPFFQIATVEVPEEHMGSVVELLGRRRGQMFDMQSAGYACYSFLLLFFFILDAG